MPQAAAIVTALRLARARPGDGHGDSIMIALPGRFDSESALTVTLAACFKLPATATGAGESRSQ